MSANRIVRIVIGLALIAYGVYSHNTWFYLGVVPLLTGILNWCPLEMKMGTCDPASGCCATPAKEDSASCCTTPSASTLAPAPTPAKKENVAWMPSDKVKIEILGTGCKKCAKLEAAAKEAVQNLEGDYEVIKVENVEDIARYGVTATPALVVNGVVKSTGRVLKPEEIRAYLPKAA